MQVSGDRAADGADAMADQNKDLRPLLNRGYRYALSLTHDSAEAEDLVHEACLSILRAEGPWRAGYLFATIRHRWIDAWRRRANAPTTEPDGDAAFERIPDAHAGAGAEALDELIRAESVARALSKLRPAEREALYLMAVEGYTAREVSRLTGRPRNSVLSSVHRARRKLRETLSVDVDGALR